MKKPVIDLLFERALKAVESNSSTEAWAKSLGLDLYTNQIEIIETMCSDEVNNMTILAARSAGKTYAVSVGAFKMCSDNPRYEILVFGPKQALASRVIDQIVQICKTHKDTLGKEIDWRHCNSAFIQFYNGSRIRALGAQEGSQIEGHHANMVIVDEAHQISDDFLAKRVTPMLKAATNPKMIKIGISLYKNNFYESCHNPTWTHLVYPWDKCPQLHNAGTITVDGKDYPKTIISDMPLSYKKELFPNNPELHFPSENNLTEEDFDTQYAMKWVDSISTFLTSDDLKQMIGEHQYIHAGVDGENYYFGLDLAGGLLINKGIKRDYSSLVIVRKQDDGLKEVVHCEEWQGDIVEQIEEITSWIHPTTGRFKCRFGTADYGSLGPAVVDILAHSGIKISGIRYRASEPSTGMPYKMAIFDNLFTELRNGYFKYPCAHDMNTNYLLKKHFEEWACLERKVNTNGNVSIAAPVSGELHDDACNACVLAVWAADKMQDELRKLERHGMQGKMVSPLVTGFTTQNRFRPQRSQLSGFLSRMGGSNG